MIIYMKITRPKSRKMWEPNKTRTVYKTAFALSVFPQMKR